MYRNFRVDLFCSNNLYLFIRYRGDQELNSNQSALEYFTDHTVFRPVSFLIRSVLRLKGEIDQL